MARGRSRTGSYTINEHSKHSIVYLTDLHLLDDEVEVVPAGVGEEARVEGEGDHRDVSLRVLEGEELGPAVAELHQARDRDDDQREHLGVGEVVLHLIINGFKTGDLQSVV